MKNEIEKIDPKEFGLDESNVLTIEQAFMPKIVERDGLKIIYEELILGDITPQLSVEAGTLRKKLVKVRTGIAEIHKSQKAYFLAAGRYVDAWKNKETLPIEQMEEKLSEIEKYAERMEAERLLKLRTERNEKLIVYGFDVATIDSAQMTEQSFELFLNGVKIAYEQKIEAEKKAEEERIAKEKAESEERERIRIENERLKKEAEAKEKQLQEERAKAEAEKKAIEEKARKEKEEAELKAKKEREEQEKILKAEREAKEKLEKEIKEKAEAEAKEKARIEIEKQQKEKAELAARRLTK